ncbi:UDP-Glycosyltransferase superfamily protein [Zea mays]|uniref:UDP-Glycosyltransferase superfamily protein n=1 Tax=Zea mays TaxID=4577 RepID=A0A1D6H748_MAIZE|nr:UDP-Glycosyltransferase superfamily protein [Zea mays]
MAGRGGAGRRPRAVFMAFGTQGDVFPIAALAAAFACDQQEYAVVFITHSAHRSLSAHLAASSVRYMPVSSPPVLAAEQLENISSDSIQSNHERESFSMRKKAIQAEHRKECLSFVEEVFGNDPSISGDFIVINFFALLSALRGNHYINVVKQLQVCWTDIIHWMWALFMESWGSWRNDCLNLSPIPFTVRSSNQSSFVACARGVTFITVSIMLLIINMKPMPYMRTIKLIHLHILYGFSKEIVECPGYWPFNAHACGFWFLPMDWQFSCDKCMELSGNINSSFGGMLCANHSSLEHFLTRNAYSSRPIFVGLSSIGRCVLI